MKKLLIETFSLRQAIVVLLITYHLSLITVSASAQNVGINSTGAHPNPSAVLDLNTGNNAHNKGFLPPQVALTGATIAAPVSSPATGLLVYDTSASTSNGLNGPGYYYWNSTQWNYLSNSGTTVSDSAWLLKGNSGTTAGTNFVGTTDAQDLVFKTNSTENMRISNANNNVGIGTSTPNSSAVLDLTNKVNQGVLIPSVVLTSITTYAPVPGNPTEGVMVYNTSASTVLPKGFYYWDATNTPNGWRQLISTLSTSGTNEPCYTCDDY